MRDLIAAKLLAFQPVLTEIETFEMPVWLRADRELRTSRRIRSVLDLLSKELQSA